MTRFPYRRVRVNGRQVYEHRHVYESHFGRLPDGWVVHHIDGDPFNNRPENLSGLPRVAHCNHHLNGG